MNLNDYLIEGRKLFEQGYETDGCSFIGWFVHKHWPHLEQACWSHDFARRELIKVEDQGENDNLFKDALKYLGAPRWLRFMMYTFTKWQGFMKDKFNMSLAAFLGFLFFLTFCVVAISMADTNVTIRYTNPTERMDDSPLKLEEIAGYKILMDGEPFTGWFYHPAVKYEFILIKVPTGKHEFQLVTVDMDGRNSDPSKAAVIDTLQPDPPVIECK